MSTVKDAYEKGCCPDCNVEIPVGAPEGWNCPNCGHACYSVKQTKSADKIIQMIAETLGENSGEFIQDIANQVLSKKVTYIGDSLFEIETDE